MVRFAIVTPPNTYLLVLDKMLNTEEVIQCYLSTGQQVSLACPGRFLALAKGKYGKDHAVLLLDTNGGNSISFTDDLDEVHAILAEELSQHQYALADNEILN